MTVPIFCSAKLEEGEAGLGFFFFLLKIEFLLHEYNGKLPGII